ncbi:TLN2 protein, partial [Operophtera brumata]
SLTTSHRKHHRARDAHCASASNTPYKTTGDASSRPDRQVTCNTTSHRKHHRARDAHCASASNTPYKTTGDKSSYHEDNKKGIWLEASRSLDYYMLRTGDLLEYNKKTRNLRVRML